MRPDMTPDETREHYDPDGEVDEQVTRAIARLCYETATGGDWHLAAVDPGLDPEWRARAVKAKRGNRYRAVRPDPPVQDR